MLKIYRNYIFCWTFRSLLGTLNNEAVKSVCM